MDYKQRIVITSFILSVFSFEQAQFQHAETTVQSSSPSSSTINIVSNYSTDQNIVTPSKDSKQLSTKETASIQTRGKLTTLDYVTTTGHAGHETNVRLTNIKLSIKPTTQRKLNPNTTHYIKQKPHSTITEVRNLETTTDKDPIVTETETKSIQTTGMITTTKTTHTNSKINQMKTERKTKSTYFTMPIEKNTESTTSTIITTTEQFTIPTKDNEKRFSQTKGKFSTNGINQTKENENSTGTIKFGNTIQLTTNHPPYQQKTNTRETIGNTIQLTTNHPPYQQKTNTRETTLQTIMLKIPMSTLDTSLLYKPTTEKQIGEHITSDHHSSDEINGSTKPGPTRGQETEPTSQSSSVKIENSTFDWLVIQGNHGSPEEHFRKLGDKEDDRYWPVAVTLIVGIPTIIVIAVSIAAMHKKRLGRPPFSRRKSFASA